MGNYSDHVCHADSDKLLETAQKIFEVTDISVNRDISNEVPNSMEMKLESKN
jgi:hypothetical protein